MGTDYFVRYVALPISVRAVTLPNTDGTFDIYINQNLCEEAQQAALRHELRHIKLGHFYDDEPVQKNEREAG